MRTPVRFFLHGAIGAVKRLRLQERRVNIGALRSREQITLHRAVKPLAVCTFSRKFATLWQEFGAMQQIKSILGTPHLGAPLDM
jgi:hypothetical protein